MYNTLIKCKLKANILSAYRFMNQALSSVHLEAFMERAPGLVKRKGWGEEK